MGYFVDNLERSKLRGKEILDEYMDRPGVDEGRHTALVDLIANLLLGFTDITEVAEEVVRLAIMHFEGDIDDALEEAMWEERNE